MTDLRRPVSLYRDGVRNVREDGAQGSTLTLEMPFNDTSDRIREGVHRLSEQSRYRRFGASFPPCFCLDAFLFIA